LNCFSQTTLIRLRHLLPIRCGEGHFNLADAALADAIHKLLPSGTAWGVDVLLPVSAVGQRFFCRFCDRLFCGQNPALAESRRLV
jgi:hypothetical protein